jgi:hypothetical protein
MTLAKPADVTFVVAGDDMTGYVLSRLPRHEGPL